MRRSSGESPGSEEEQLLQHENGAAQRPAASPSFFSSSCSLPKVLTVGLVSLALLVTLLWSASQMLSAPSCAPTEQQPQQQQQAAPVAAAELPTKQRAVPVAAAALTAASWLPSSPPAVADCASAAAWTSAHVDLLLASQLRLSIFLQTFRASQAWPVLVEAGDAQLTVFLSLPHLWSLLTPSSKRDRYYLLTGDVTVTLRLEPQGLERSRRLDMKDGGHLCTAADRYRQNGGRQLPAAEEQEEEEADTEQQQQEVQLIGPAPPPRELSGTAGKSSFRFVGVNASVPLYLTLTARNGSHLMHSRLLQAEDRPASAPYHCNSGSDPYPSQGCPAPLVWPAFPLSYAARCRDASPLSAPSTFRYMPVQPLLRPFPPHPDPTYFVRRMREPRQSLRSDWRFHEQWLAFNQHHLQLMAEQGWPSEDDAAQRCGLTAEVVLSSPMTRMLQQRVWVQHFADLLYAADHALPPPPAGCASPSLSRAALLRSLPPRRLLSVEKAMLPEYCGKGWWDWYSSYATSHLLRVQQSRSSSDATREQPQTLPRWPQSDSELLTRFVAVNANSSSLLPLRFVQLERPRTGWSDQLKGLVTTLLESALGNRVFALFADPVVYIRLLSTSIASAPEDVAPALLLSRSRGDEELETIDQRKRRRRRWSHEPLLGFMDKPLVFSSLQRRVVHYEMRATEQLLITVGGWFGLSGDVVESRRYRPLFTSLGINASNVFACVCHAFYQLRLASVLEAHLDVVTSAVYSSAAAAEDTALMEPPFAFAYLHPLSFRLSLLSTLLRPEWSSVGLQLRDMSDSGFRRAVELFGPAMSGETPAKQTLFGLHLAELQCVMHRVQALQRRDMQSATQQNLSLLASPPQVLVFFMSDRVEQRRAVVKLFGSAAQQALLRLSGSPPAEAESVAAWPALLARLQACRSSGCMLTAWQERQSLRSLEWLQSPIAASSPVSPWLTVPVPRMTRQKGDDQRDNRLAMFEQLLFAALTEHVVDVHSGFGRVAAWSSLSQRRQYAAIDNTDTECWDEERGFGTHLDKEYYMGQEACCDDT